MKRVLYVSVVLTLLLSAGVGQALAHAKIDKCTPAGGTTVTTAPAQVVCVYTEEIDSKLSNMKVTDATGAQVDKKDAHVDLNDADHKTLVVSLDPALAKTGLLTVTWHTVTTDDGGITDGLFQFVVGASASTPKPTTQEISGGQPQVTSSVTATVNLSATVAATKAPTAAATSAVTVAPTSAPSTAPTAVVTAAPTKAASPTATTAAPGTVPTTGGESGNPTLAWLALLSATMALAAGLYTRRPR